MKLKVYDYQVKIAISGVDILQLLVFNYRDQKSKTPVWQIDGRRLIV